MIANPRVVEGKLMYTSGWGVFELPTEVLVRAARLLRRFGRAEYLDDWCRFQASKKAT